MAKSFSFPGWVSPALQAFPHSRGAAPLNPCRFLVCKSTWTNYTATWAPLIDKRFHWWSADCELLWISSKRCQTSESPNFLGEVAVVGWPWPVPEHPPSPSLNVSPMPPEQGRAKAENYEDQGSLISEAKLPVSPPSFWHTPGHSKKRKPWLGASPAQQQPKLSVWPILLQNCSLGAALQEIHSVPARSSSLLMFTSQVFAAG